VVEIEYMHMQVVAPDYVMALKPLCPDQPGRYAIATSANYNRKQAGWTDFMRP